MPNSVELEITKADIVNGRRNSPSKCAAGLAMARAFPGKYVSCGFYNAYVYVTPGDDDEMRLDTCEVYRLPENLTEFIRNFDERGGTVVPGKFTLTLEENNVETPESV